MTATDAPTKTASRARARRSRRTIDAKLRKRIERAVDRLIAALDVMDAPTGWQVFHIHAY